MLCDNLVSLAPPWWPRYFRGDRRGRGGKHAGTIERILGNKRVQGPGAHITQASDSHGLLPIEHLIGGWFFGGCIGWRSQTTAEQPVNVCSTG